MCLQCRRPKFDPWVGRAPWRSKWLPTAVFFPGESHEQRSLAGYSPWGCKESDMTEQACLHTNAVLTMDTREVLLLLCSDLCVWPLACTDQSVLSSSLGDPNLVSFNTQCHHIHKTTLIFLLSTPPRPMAGQWRMFCGLSIRKTLAGKDHFLLFLCHPLGLALG